ncbi:MAG TPA: hypothetical protein VJM46_01595 [Candidatus Saccharimonadales bacterium]|nr:hypothetical protein [Candidatus Saccharimonadales bacterium]
MCHTHHRDHEHTSPWFYRNFGQGKTLAEAAYVRGYWSAPRDRFLCRGCRGRDGNQHSAQIVAKSKTWPRQDAFGFALSAACSGYVITEPGISYADVVKSWLQMNWQPIETIEITRLVRPAKTRRAGMGQRREVRPAQHTIDKFRGWSFPGTVQVMSRNMHTDAEIWDWGGRTDILTNGHVLHMGQPAEVPLTGATYRLIVEMARKMFLTRGHTWKGPQENWGA